jgi:nitrite reductase/ring-hydroxylating ferredoxin subunit
MSTRRAPTDLPAPRSAAEGDHDRQCGGCELANRRTFLTQAAAIVVGAMVGLGMSADRAMAMPLGIVNGVRLSNGKDASYPIPAADGATIDRDNDVIIARYQGHVFAFGLACPHQNTALRWVAAEGRFQCPKHKSKYAPDGTFLSGRATRSMDRYAVRKDGTNIVVSLDSLYEQDKQQSAWESAFVAV